MNTVVLFLGGVILFLACIVLGRILYGALEPVHVARNVRGQLIPMVEIKEAVDERMSNVFVTDAIQEMFQLTSDTYTKKIPEMNAYVTDKGYANYISLLQDLGIPAKIQMGPTVMTTEIGEALVIDRQESRVYDGKFVWVYYVSAIHTIKTSEGSVRVDKKYKVSMQHMSLAQRPFGLAIYSIRSV